MKEFSIYVGSDYHPAHAEEAVKAPADVAQWIECHPANQRVARSIPSQGTCLGCRPGPQWETPESQPHTDTSLPLSPSPL